ncbi:MAG: hypothetical protein L3J67_00960 [Hyphomicrobiaceae bacterium]|nr:hypothetical protein [Hyphomicrobiaceae bacterium]
MGHKLKREFLAKARAIGIEKVRILHGGKHPKMLGEFEGKAFKIPIPKTPSDFRSVKNWLAELKRLLGISGQGCKKNSNKSTNNRKTKFRRSPKSVRCPCQEAPHTDGPRPHLTDDPWAALVPLRDQLTLV